MNSIVDFPTLTHSSNFSQFELQFDRELSTLFSWMNPTPRPCFNSVLLDEIRKAESLLELHQGYFNDTGSPHRVDFMVFGSKVPGVFNLGGDLGMFIEAIMRKDREPVPQGDWPGGKHHYHCAVTG
jgi:DSF synthase